ncbi:hypothetical protein BGZ83_010910 [Gryganskiella cystojenkinii]|nr:hypothetical protein BGZ83_010910 [Gryganskiella cystojenkinii]
MSAQSRKHSATTSLQPNTVLSSRASIFGDDNNNQPEHHFHIHKSKHAGSKQKSNRPGQDDSQVDPGDDLEDPEEAYSKAVLERLYGKLAGEIEIQDDTESSQATKVVETKAKRSGNMDVDEEEEEEQVMEFRLFASSTDDKDDTPTSLVVLNPKAPVEIYVHRERADLDESPGSERMRQIVASAIDAKTIMDQAAIPWARTFFAHKVIHVPLEQKDPSKPTRKSKRKREFEKKIKKGLISETELASTARKVKVSDSYGKTPFIMRKGLDRNTIDPGTATAGEYGGDRGRGRGRGGARGGRGGDRGSSRGGRGGRGGGRGGASMSSTGSEKKSDKLDSNTGVQDPSTAKRPSSDSAEQNSATPKPLKKKKSKTTDTPTTISTPVSTLASSTGTTTENSTTPTISTKKSKKDSLPPKEPKNKKPANKIDNIMAMLLGK